jgi:hypothetical protein
VLNRLVSYPVLLGALAALAAATIPATWLGARRAARAAPCGGSLADCELPGRP